MVRLYSRIIYWVLGVVGALFLLQTVWNSQREQISRTVTAQRQKWASGGLGSSALSSSSYPRENATFVTLARNDDLEKLLPSVASVEDRFNHKYHYDWVFLNEDDFSDEFKESITALVSGKAKFGKIPKEHWSYPPWIDQTKAADSRKKMADEGIIYGDNEPYRHMCRFESGFFYRHPLMMDYRYYWRVEPETSMFCDIDFDVFKFMRENNKKYGWTISITEYERTIPTLWDTTMKFIKENPQAVHPKALQNFVRDDHNRDKYNLCHFWSNFEVADADFWRGETYSKYFNYLDKAGGFFYERWGDAPVHSLAASFFMSRDDVHFFDTIGYFHPPFSHCPAAQKEKGLRCYCLPEKSFDWHKSSCLRTYYRAKGIPYPKDYRQPFG